MTTRGSNPSIEGALRHLGARRYGNLTEIIEHAIRRPGGRTGTILGPLTRSTSVLGDRTAAERARALWSVIVESILDPRVSSSPQSRRRRALHAAFRLPDPDIREWGASLTDRFKQLKALSIFGDATSTQPMEIAWKRGVEGLAEHLEERFAELSTPDGWAPYLPVNPESPAPRGGAPMFRRPSEGAQKLVVNLFVITVVQTAGQTRRISERLITSTDDEGLQYYVARAYSYNQTLGVNTYVPTQALWGCRAEQAIEAGLPATRLRFPRPLRRGERAHFISETVLTGPEDDVSNWTDVDVDHYGIEPGEVRDGVLPISGLTIRIKFEPDAVPKSAWWYGEQNESERYIEPPADSPRRLDVAGGEVTKTFEQPCQPRESYGIAYKWS